MDRSERPLTRADFFAQGDWLRHCHEGALEPVDVVQQGLGPLGDDEASKLFGAIHGATATLRAWVLEGGEASECLTYEQFKAAWEAVLFANCQGRILNAFVTITWPTVGISVDFFAGLALRSFLSDLTPWFARFSLAPMYVWVHERGHRRGIHSHIAFAIPPAFGASFRQECTAVLTRVVGRPLLMLPDSRTLDVDVDAFTSIGRQWPKIQYLFKGLTPSAPGRDRQGRLVDLATAAGLGLEDQGVVGVARAGIAKDFGPDAIAAWRATKPLLPPFPELREVHGKQAIYTDAFLRWFEAMRAARKAP